MCNLANQRASPEANAAVSAADAFAPKIVDELVNHKSVYVWEKNNLWNRSALV